MTNFFEEKIKVAYVIGGLPFGGVENWLLDLSLELRGDEFIDPYIINVSGTGDLMAKYEEMGIEVISIGGNKKSINTHRMDTVLKLRHTLKALQVDVVHTLHFSGDFFGRLAAMGLGIPVLTHIRNIKSESKFRRRLFNRILSWCTTEYLSVSKAAVKTIQRDHNWAHRPVRVLYNAVNPEKLDVAPLDLEKRYGLTGRVIIGVGRVVEQKNFDKLIRAVAAVRKTVPDVSLLILGDGNMMPELLDLRVALKAEEYVVLAGYIPNTNVPEHLKAAHVLAMPSEYEGLPVTHVEALHCGLPAVISEHVPSVEIAEKASLVCSTDEADIAEKIELLLSDSSLYDQMSHEATKVASEYSIACYLDKLKAIYREVVGRVAA